MHLESCPQPYEQPLQHVAVLTDPQVLVSPWRETLQAHKASYSLKPVVRDSSVCISELDSPWTEAALGCFIRFLLGIPAEKSHRTESSKRLFCSHIH